MRDLRLADASVLIKEHVKSRDFAENKGIKVNNKGFAVCPFHSEKTASLKFYDDGSWYCYGCHKGGDAIAFAMEYYGEPYKETLRLIDADFQLGAFKQSAESRLKAYFSRVKQETNKQTANKYEREYERLSAKYDAAYRDWLACRENADKNRPLSDGDWNDTFASAAKALSIAEIELDLAESAFNSLCYEHRTH